MYTDCQLKDFKLNSDLMKSMILGFVLFLKIVLTAHLQNGLPGYKKRNLEQ